MEAASRGAEGECGDNCLYFSRTQHGVSHCHSGDRVSADISVEHGGGEEEGERTEGGGAVFVLSVPASVIDRGEAGSLGRRASAPHQPLHLAFSSLPLNPTLPLSLFLSSLPISSLHP